MKISIDVKPVKVIAPTKQLVINKAIDGKKSHYSGLPSWQQRSEAYHNSMISQRGYTVSGKHSSEDIVILMNFHKVRRKVSQSRPKNGKKTKSTVITPAHWVAYVYTFNMIVLKAAGIKKISQNSRNFSLSF